MRRLNGFKTKDSALAYFVNQLENLDKRLYEPLVSVTWGRDIKLRSGISMSQESTSFIQSAFAGPGSLSANLTYGGNMPWISPETTALVGVDVNGQKILTPLRPLGRELSYTSIELERSQNTQQPIDLQKMNALNMLYQMNTDQMVYVGSSDVGATGLCNNSSVTAGTVATGASGSTLWTNKTPLEILADINTELTNVWTASAFAVCPGKLLLPPTNYTYITSQLISSAGNMSILKFVQENSISLGINGKPLEIVPVKWLTGLGANGTNRMVVYTNEEERVRFPMVPIRRETAYYQGIRFACPYIWAFGQVEFPYTETVGYADGI